MRRADVNQCLRDGCSVRSFLLEQAVTALADNPTLEGVGAAVADTGMGRWTAEEAIRLAVATPVLTAALQARFASRDNTQPANRLLVATRAQIGGTARMRDSVPSLAGIANQPEPSHGAILSWAGEVIEEIHRVVEAVDPASLTALLAVAGQARRVFFSGSGRSGLVAKAVAMRWMHLGVTAYVAGETVTPAIGDDDLLVCLSASGRSAATLAHASTARGAGARVVALTATPNSPLADAADLVVVIPAGTSVATVQHAGSLFEQTSLILGDALCSAFQELHVIADRDLNRRHANLP